MSADPAWNDGEYWPGADETEPPVGEDDQLRRGGHRGGHAAHTNP